MKKKRFAGLALLAPLCLLTACGGGGPTTIPLAPYWEYNAAWGVDGAGEQLEYTVHFEAPENRGDYYVSYDDGTYTTSLSAENVSVGGSAEMVYVYKTELSISGRYTNGETVSDTFHDYVRSEVRFRDTQHNLRPVSSAKTVRSTNPSADPSSAICEVICFNYAVEYNYSSEEGQTDLTGAHITLTNLDEETGEPLENAEPTTADVEIDPRDASFFDNEELLFAIRGMDMSAAVSFNTIDIQTRTVVGVTFPEAPQSTSLTLPEAPAIGGTVQEGEIKAYRVQFAMDTERPGTTRTAYYAALTDANANTFRNMLLRLDDDLPNGYGTLRYTLKSAVFSR